MSDGIVEGLLIGPSQRRLFTVFRPASGRPRAALLICPPFFHEQFLSYRLLTLMGMRLAERGIASLRFDYLGTGDSAGDEAAFSLAGAIADGNVALDALRQRLPDVPLIVFGARAGAWPAASVAASHHLPLWLWQPLPDGADWIHALEDMDARERASRARYPFLGPVPKPVDPDRLLASYCPASLRAEIAQAKLADILARGDIAIDVVDDDESTVLPFARRTLRFPHSAGRWHAHIDIRAAFVTREMAACVEALAQDIESAAP